MEKIVLVHYINCPNGVFNDAMVILQKKLEDENVISYFIKTNGESRVECINPRLVSEEEYTSAKIALERAHKISKEVTDSFEKMAKTYPNDFELGRKIREISRR
jgi:hypothetical protein